MHAPEDQSKRSSKLALLLRLLLKNPAEFWDRVLTIAEFQADRLWQKATLASFEWTYWCINLKNIWEANFIVFSTRQHSLKLKSKCSRPSSGCLKNQLLKHITMLILLWGGCVMRSAVCGSRKLWWKPELDMELPVRSCFKHWQSIIKDNSGVLTCPRWRREQTSRWAAWFHYLFVHAGICCAEGH